MDILAGWRVELIGQGLIGRRTTGPNARVAATPLSDWRSAIYDRAADACVANLADHANLQQRSNEERAQLITAAGNMPGKKTIFRVIDTAGTMTWVFQ